MNIRLLTSVLVAALAACQTPDVGDEGSFDHHSSRAGDDDDDDDAPKKKKSTTTTTKSAPVPVQVDASAPAVDPFANSSFRTLIPNTETREHHLDTTNAGKDCLLCHGEGMGAPRFVFAGTVRRAKTGTAGASDVEVRVVDAEGNDFAHVGTDSAGNFWLEDTAKLPAGARIGIRSATSKKQMSAPITAGGCNTNGCHDASRPIYIDD